MTCCGKTKAVFNIIQGNVLNVVDTLFQLPLSKYEYADIRLATCRLCDESTWLFSSEYVDWLKSHGIEILKNISDLSAMQKLNKLEYRHKSKLFCRICKCWLPAKTYVKNEQCPLNKWSTENG